MKTFQVEVIIKPWEEGGFLAEAPAIQGCRVVAPTVTQAMEQIVEVVQMHLDLILEQGKPLPKKVAKVSRSEIKAKVAVGLQ